jgi:hypothetical protein
MSLIVPHGINEIIATFGNVSKYVADDGIVSAKEEDEFLITMPLPYPMIYAYDKTKTVKRMRCHKLMADIFTETFNEILSSKLQDKFMEYGGCYNFRSKRLSARLSTHSWGIAIDGNPNTNRMGTKGDMAPEIVSIFTKHGFIWGGYWKVSDSMHFQYCSGY